MNATISSAQNTAPPNEPSGRAFARLAFTASVKAAQVRYGTRETMARLERSSANDRLTAELAAFIGTLDSFLIGTTTLGGWPHVQHRGGPAGVLKVLDERTLAFGDFGGNRQYITVGNLAENDRVFLFLIDHVRGKRLKIWGRGDVLDDPELIARVACPGYPAPVERVIRIHVEAWDTNCPRHIPHLIPAVEVERLVADYEQRLAAAGDRRQRPMNMTCASES